MICAIHQPEYFPWLGLVHKARRADVFVHLDHVQFDRASLQQRCRVIGANGPFWLTIPFVHRHPQRIDELTFADARWQTKHWKSLQAAYGRAPGWKSAAPMLEAYYGRAFERVADATIASTELLFAAFGVGTRTVRASTLAARSQKSDLVLDLCRELGATTYLSGRTGATYLDRDAFAAAGIEIQVQRYDFPAYRPLTDDERKGLSALDAWAFLGENARSLS